MQPAHPSLITSFNEFCRKKREMLKCPIQAFNLINFTTQGLKCGKSHKRAHPNAQMQYEILSKLYRLVKKCPFYFQMNTFRFRDFKKRHLLSGHCTFSKLNQSRISLANSDRHRHFFFITTTPSSQQLEPIYQDLMKFNLHSPLLPHKGWACAITRRACLWSLLAYTFSR